MMDDIDRMAYRFWSIHPKDIPEPVGMPEGYPGGVRAWFYASEIRGRVEAQAALVAEASEVIRALLDEYDGFYINAKGERRAFIEGGGRDPDGVDRATLLLAKLDNA